MGCRHLLPAHPPPQPILTLPASPQVGNAAFADEYNAAVPDTWAIINGEVRPGWVVGGWGRGGAGWVGTGVSRCVRGWAGGRGGAPGQQVGGCMLWSLAADKLNGLTCLGSDF